MRITISEKEAQAILELKVFIRQCATPAPEFLSWVVARLVEKYGDDPNVDFVIKLREYAALFNRLQHLLSERV